jgi:hypothetical protein
MSDVDPRLVAALQRRPERRPAGARRVGWKVGQGERESARFAFGPSVAAVPEDAEATLVVNGEERRRGRVPAETVGRIGEVERVLRDRVIAGSVVSRGDRVVAEIEGLGRAELTIA